MTSDQLQRLRNLHKEHRKLFQAVRAGTQHIIENPYLEDTQRRQLLAQHVAQAKEQLAALAASRESAVNTISQRATARRMVTTAEARAKVQRWLDQGISPTDLSQLLAEEKDRAGIAALRAELPYLEKAKKLPAPRQDIEAILDAREKPLWDDNERRLQAETREASINTGLLMHNERELAKWIDVQPLADGYKRMPGQMRTYAGTPEKPSKSTILDLEAEEE